jgi:ADP-ribosylglycohydrolase
MPPVPPDYLERVYAGFIGKNVGIRLGAPVEPAIWTYERIREIYGDIRGYIKPFRNFAADDDANGPVFFIRSLVEADRENRFYPSDRPGPVKPLEPMDVGRAWLDYSREGKGMFWWGGYGVSTEHTAYLNLKAGIDAPESGSLARNGATVAEQIGGQIFIDTWGLVWPGNPAMAARYAAIASSVSHDGEGLEGARFIAACIAAAFLPPKGGIRAVIDAGLAELSPASTYTRVAKAVIAFHEAHPADWRLCQDYLIAEWGYDRYPGLCHMIPNAGVCVLALLYGGGDFSRTVEIATMCGWDTDCNAGNVGTILGVLCGLGGIPAGYRDPINDGIVLSGLPGALNILDIPTFSRVLASIGHRLAGEAVPQAISSALARGDGEAGFSFDFALPGSTHGLRVSDPVNFAIAHRAGLGPAGGNALEFRFERMPREASGKLFWKPFYRRADFEDERYSPVFSPVARPGQSVRISFRYESWEGEKVGITGYVRDSFTGKDLVTTAPIFPVPDKDFNVEFAIPEVGGAVIDEVGLIVTGFSGAARRDSGRLLVDSFEIGGKARYAIDLSRQVFEFGCVTPFSHDGGRWTLEAGRMHLMTNMAAASWTGGHSVGDQRITARVTPLAGGSHLLSLRCAGAMRGYFAGFDGQGKVAIWRKDFGLVRLAQADFAWERGRDYELAFEAIDDKLGFSVDGTPLIKVGDSRHRRGMVGCGSLEAARTFYGPFMIEEL